MEVLHICLHKARALFKTNQLPPSTGSMNESKDVSQENRLRMEGGKGSAVKRLVLTFLKLLAGYQTQTPKHSIIISSIPFTDTDLDLVILIQWPHMWQSQWPKQTTGSFWKDSFCAVFLSLHYFSCRGSQPDLLGSIQRLIQRWVLPGLYSGKEWTKAGEWPANYYGFRVQVQFKQLSLHIHFWSISAHIW